MAENDDGPRGFSKITGGLTDLINLLVDLDKSGDLPHHGRREKNGVVVEYSVGQKTASGARSESPDEPTRAKADRSPPRRAAQSTDIEVVEPVTDTFDEPNEMVFLFELPGVARSAIHCIVDGDILVLDAKRDGRLYRKEILIEAKLTSDPPKLRLHNGVLEVRLMKQV